MQMVACRFEYRLCALQLSACGLLKLGYDNNQKEPT